MGAGLGGATCGAGGAAAGLVTGGALGGAAGIPFAFFTLGLSIPVGAMLGGGFGLVAGGAAGTTVGATAGGAFGYGGFTKRAEIRTAILAARTQVRQGAKKIKDMSTYFVARSYSGVQIVQKDVLMRISAMRSRALTLARAAKEKAKELAKDRRTQVTAASAGLGGATCGAGGAAAGLVTGGALGGAAGIPFAFFTLGLSIPVGAMLGGGFGVVAGGAAGTTVGATAGGALGYGGFTKRAEIRAAISAVRARMRQATHRVKEVSTYFAARTYSTVQAVKKAAF